MHRALQLLRTARFAPALACSLSLSQVQTRCGVDLSRARARSGFSRGHLLDIVVYVPGGLGDARERDAAESLVQLSIGEELFERWVGTVTVAATVRGGPLTVLNTSSQESSAFPIAELPDAIRAAVAGLKLGLSKEPLFRQADAEDWVLFELTPELAADYTAQDDLVFASTRVPELKKSFLRGEPFFSGRFSDAGELFAYLKYEGMASTSEARLTERGAIEAALSQVLSERGAIVGLGLGIRYGYLDLALVDLDCVETLLLPALRALGVAKRAWFLFCDSELEREWIAVHSDTPEPFWG